MSDHVRKNITLTVRRAGFREESGGWLDLTPEQRVELAAELSEELWALAHPNTDEPRLCRSVAVLRKA